MQGCIFPPTETNPNSVKAKSPQDFNLGLLNLIGKCVTILSMWCEFSWFWICVWRDLLERAVLKELEHSSAIMYYEADFHMTLFAMECMESIYIYTHIPSLLCVLTLASGLNFYESYSQQDLRYFAVFFYYYGACFSRCWKNGTYTEKTRSISLDKSYKLCEWPPGTVALFMKYHTFFNTRSYFLLLKLLFNS